MDDMHDYSIANGTRTVQPQSLPMVPRDHALVPLRQTQARADEERESRQHVIKQRKSKRRPRQPLPQPKSTWPVVVGAIFIVLYICSPVDVIPDVPVIGAWDDIALAIFGMRKLDKRRKDSEEEQQHFHQFGQQPTWCDDHARTRQSMPQLPCATLPPEKPGFFARVTKAISMIFGG